jgi:type I restriction enzyme S subunit
MIDELCPGWIMARLGDLCTVTTGKRDVNAATPDGAYPFFTCGQKIYRITTAPFEGESILVAGNGFFNVKYFDGKFDAYQRTYVLQNFAVDGKFLYRYIQFRLDDITKDNRGSTINYIRLGDLTEHFVPVAPLNEQRRIVAKMEKLLSRVDAAQARLTIIPHILKRFRQSVLAAACSGKLTADWRESVKTEIASRMLRRRGIPTVDGDFNSLPETWARCKFGDYVENHDGKRIPIESKEREKRKGDYPYYGASGVIDSIDGFTHQGKFLLIGEDGANLLARSKPIAFIVEGKIWVNNHAHVLSCKDDLPNRYLCHYINSIDLQPYVTGSAQPKLTQTNLNRIPVPVAPLEEQQEIVRRVEALFKTADALEARYLKAKKHIDKLTQSILSKAFRGELVPQNPNDEPASVLLQRVKLNKTSR